MAREAAGEGERRGVRNETRIVTLVEARVGVAGWRTRSIDHA
jgi:hypothetical protein